MDVRIQAVNFEIAQRLTDHINKKAERLGRHYPAITTVDVILKVVKPESAINKEVVVTVVAPGIKDTVGTKTADSFEEAYDKALEAIDGQLERIKKA